MFQLLDEFLPQGDDKMFGKKSKDQASSTQVANAMKTLLANIRFIDVDNPVKSIVITSSVPDEGKSFVSLKLAEAIATSGKSVLLVEGDLRRRSLAQRLGVRCKRGMYSVVSGAVDLRDAVVPTKTKKMFFLDVEKGIPNPSDLFASRRFHYFLDVCQEGFDYVVIDTPPLDAFVDAAVLSTYVDATFLVVRQGKTKRDQITEAVAQLRQVGGNLEGVIMNDCKDEAGSYYYYDDKKRDQGSAPVFDPSVQIGAESAQNRPPLHRPGLRGNNPRVAVPQEPLGAPNTGVDQGAVSPNPYIVEGRKNRFKL